MGLNGLFSTHKAAGVDRNGGDITAAWARRRRQGGAPLAALEPFFPLLLAYNTSLNMTNLTVTLPPPLQLFGERNRSVMAVASASDARAKLRRLPSLGGLALPHSGWCGVHACV